MLDLGLRSFGIRFFDAADGALEIDRFIVPSFPAQPVSFQMVTRVTGFHESRTYNLFYMLIKPNGERKESPHFLCAPPHPQVRELITFCTNVAFEEPGVYQVDLWCGPRVIDSAKLLVKKL
ncbi:hypothetical protein ACP3TJ_07715 [Desulforudis sp. 1088]|uniref:hypothetical protein n=1 Tax=unclassified Candidatus Desulforudis TaxID=2635950 RepID=UPI00346DB133